MIYKHNVGYTQNVVELSNETAYCSHYLDPTDKEVTAILDKLLK